MRQRVVQQGGGLDGELGEEVYQEEEDETGDRQAVSTAVRDDRAFSSVSNYYQAAVKH